MAELSDDAAFNLSVDLATSRILSAVDEESVQARISALNAIGLITFSTSIVLAATLMGNALYDLPQESKKVVMASLGRLVGRQEAGIKAMMENAANDAQARPISLLEDVAPPPAPTAKPKILIVDGVDTVH